MAKPDGHYPKYHALREARLRAAGLCALCGKNPSTERACPTCRERVNTQRAIRAAVCAEAGLCVYCKKTAMVGKRWCEACYRYQVDRSARLKKNGLCVVCATKHAAPGKSRCPSCNAKGLECSRRHHQMLKREILSHYGTVCARCGETKPTLLCIDHINGGGRAHLREISKQPGHAFYDWLKSHGFPPGFQTLCFSCNLEKGGARG